MKGWRPPLLRKHTGTRIRGKAAPLPEPWPSPLDVATARRAIKRYPLMNPLDPREQPLVLVLIADKQHDAAVTMAAALDAALERLANPEDQPWP